LPLFGASVTGRRHTSRCPYPTGREVDVAPAQRNELAAAQTGERCREEDRPLVLGVRRADEGPHLLRPEDLDLVVARKCGFSTSAIAL
jgi:hypothetical protein